MKRFLPALIIGVLITANAWAQTATVNLSSVKQLIRGYGGINHPVWVGDLTAEQRNTAFGNGPGQMGMSVLRIWVSDNRNQWSQELATAKRAIEHGAIVFASPWNPPSNMIETFTRGSQTNAKRLRYDMYSAYAQHLNDFVAYMKNNGVELYAISVQNEPDYAHDWTWWTPQEVLRFMKENAGSINCRVIAPESFQYLKNLSDPILNDPQALANMDILGAHLYGTQVSNFPYPLFKQKGAGKELWMTEVYHPNSDANSADRWPEALEVGYHIHNAMVEAEFQAYVWWYIRRQYSPMKEDGTISKRGYCMSQYSKFVRPGYERVDATKNPTTDVYVSAYKKGDDVVMVVINRGTSSRSVTLSIPGTKVTTWERYVTSGSKNLAKEANINSATGSFAVTLEPQSMSTFVGKAAPGSPVVAITEPANNAEFTAPATVNLTATASDPDGTISKVEFFNGTTKLGEDATSPYNYSWSNVAEGTYTITAVATDNAGNKSTSAAVTVKVNVPQGPYNGTAHAIPGTIQFEAYDVGGNGFAYMDNTPGSEVTPVVNFRTTEDVDIENCTDTGGGYNIGFATAGEWLEYTVNVQTAGTYHMDLRVACNGEGRTLSVSMDGTNIASNVAIPNTAGWQTWQTVRVSDIALTAGQKVMRVTIGATDYINMNYVTFALSNNLPTVSITAPSSNSTFTTLETVTLTATASDSDGNIASVSFYSGNTLLGTDNTSPYSYSWSGMSAGTHTITAKATDDKGGVTTSAPVTVVIQGVQSPFNTNRHTIPGRIEAEEYDLGGEGLGYHEANTNGNQGGATFRNDEVDIETTGDADGDYNISYILQDEWLEYSVEVQVTGTYDLDVRVASDGAGKTFHIEIDGADVTGPITVPNTGGFQTWATVNVPGISLTEGDHQMRIVFDASYFNLNYVTFNEIITSVSVSGTAHYTIYPNPFNAKGLQIKKDGDFLYRIKDVNGAVIEEGKGDGHKVIGTNLVPGIYFLSIEQNNEVSFHKIVKQ